MKKTIFNFISATVLAITGILFATTCTAASNGTALNSAPLYSKNNLSVYADSAVGWGSVDIDSSAYNDLYTGQSPSSFSNNSVAWNADLGLQFNQYIAIETGYISFGQSSATTTNNTVPTDGKDAFAGFDVLLKGILPVNDKFNLFVKLGTADMHDKGTATESGLATITDTGTTWTPLVGFGASYDLNQHASLTLQDMYSSKTSYQVNNLDIDMPALNAILAGVSFKFNA